MIILFILFIFASRAIHFIIFDVIIKKINSNGSNEVEIRTMNIYEYHENTVQHIQLFAKINKNKTIIRIKDKETTINEKLNTVDDIFKHLSDNRSKYEIFREGSKIYQDGGKLTEEESKKINKIILFSRLYEKEFHIDLTDKSITNAERKLLTRIEDDKISKIKKK